MMTCMMNGRANPSISLIISAITAKLPAGMIGSVQLAGERFWKISTVILCLQTNDLLQRRLPGCFRYRSVFPQSRILPSVEMVTTCHGINFPLCCNAAFAACSSPPQQGTSIRTMVTLWMSLLRMISVSFSA